MTGWDGWMASPTQWTWVWVNSEVYSNGGCKESDMTEWLNWTELNWRSLWEYCDWDLYLGLTDSTHGFASVPQTSCVHLIKSSSHCSLAELLECSKVSFWNVPKSGTWKRKVYIFICLLPFVVTRMSGCMLLGSVSSQQRFGVTDIKALGVSLLSTLGLGGGDESQPFGSSFYVFFLPLGLPYVNWAGQECYLFYLRSSLWSFVLFSRAFPLPFSHCHSELLFPILTT